MVQLPIVAGEGHSVLRQRIGASQMGQDAMRIVRHGGGGVGGGQHPSHFEKVLGEAIGQAPVAHQIA